MSLLCIHKSTHTMITISAISYLNTIPFLYGLQHSGQLYNFDLNLDVPSACAEKLINNKIDIGIVPVAIIPFLEYHEIISDYCIGANDAVKTVLLVSNKPLHLIEKIYLDYDSRTSVQLVKVLAKNFWKIDPEWEKLNKEDVVSPENIDSAVLIGDKTFYTADKYFYVYDLALEWKRFTSLPFVFACWVANKKLPDDFISQFNTALQLGLDNRPALIEELNALKKYNTDISFYLNSSIKYNYDEAKKKALKLFLSYCEEL